MPTPSSHFITIITISILFFLPTKVTPFSIPTTTTTTKTTTTTNHHPRTPIIDSLTPTKHQHRHPLQLSEKTPSSENCEPCPTEPFDNDNPDMDRREAAFAMIGGLWSMGVIPSVVMPAAFSSSPEVANAVYGEDAKIQIPNMVGGMTDRINKQCLVETLGNRECLVYLDPENKLYQGTDDEILIERLEKATIALTTIPTLVEQKKWGGVTGVLTGPMGQLSETMNMLAKKSENRDDVLAKVKKFKTDLFAMAAAADKKDGGKILESQKMAMDDLVDFVAAL